jgi:hypothetical protein
MSSLIETKYLKVLKRVIKDQLLPVLKMCRLNFERVCSTSSSTRRCSMIASYEDRDGVRSGEGMRKKDEVQQYGGRGEEKKNYQYCN